MERVTLEKGVLGFSAFGGTVEGHEFVAERVDSHRGILSETFFYSTGEGEALSVFTVYNGILNGRLVVDGKGYFISEEGDHFLVVRSAARDREEILHLPLEKAPPQDRYRLLFAPPVAGALASGHQRQRTCCSSYTLPGIVTLAISADYVAALGSEDKARARAAHMIDRQDAAFQNSSFFDAKFVNPEVIIIDPPAEVIERGLYDWAVNTPSNTVIRDLRKRNKAAGTFILSKGTHVSEAPRNSPGKWLPEGQVAIVGGFFAEWDDGDIRAFIHEAGHFCGGDHNIENAPPQATDLQGANRDWYDCEMGVIGALSLNVCHKFLDPAEVYSGANALYLGKATGKIGVNDNVGGMRKVWKDLGGAHD